MAINRGTGCAHNRSCELTEFGATCCKSLFRNGCPCGRPLDTIPQKVRTDHAFIAVVPRTVKQWPKAAGIIARHFALVKPVFD